MTDGPHVAFPGASRQLECKYQMYSIYCLVFHKCSALLSHSLYKKRKHDDDQRRHLRAEESGGGIQTMEAITGA